MNNDCLTPEVYQKFERSIRDIQIYGTQQEIEAVQSLILNINTKGYPIDNLLNILRNNLRKEIGLEMVKKDSYWIVDTVMCKLTN
ncbi:MAG TPA: hypothetical protein VFM82_02345 [Flavobacteriaceae bacterium]|nr:hypothetical protein [Flavobacteriaceae bacterium]